MKHWETFDAACFGITPSEAALMDPQQRVMLEVTYASNSSSKSFALARCL